MNCDLENGQQKKIWTVLSSTLLRRLNLRVSFKSIYHCHLCSEQLSGRWMGKKNAESFYQKLEYSSKNSLDGEGMLIVAYWKMTATRANIPNVLLQWVDLTIGCRAFIHICLSTCKEKLENIHWHLFKLVALGLLQMLG